jgi:hypothetical protein
MGGGRTRYLLTFAVVGGLVVTAMGSHRWFGEYFKQREREIGYTVAATIEERNKIRRLFGKPPLPEPEPAQKD